MKIYIPITKIEFRNELTNIANDFNTTWLIPYINGILASDGYNPL
jgi:hypothetical protein